MTDKFFKGDKRDTVWNQDLAWIRRCRLERRELTRLEQAKLEAARTRSPVAMPLKYNPALVPKRLGLTGTLESLADEVEMVATVSVTENERRRLLALDSSRSYDRLPRAARVPESQRLSLGGGDSVASTAASSTRRTGSTAARMDLAERCRGQRDARRAAEYRLQALEEEMDELRKATASLVLSTRLES